MNKKQKIFLIVIVLLWFVFMSIYLMFGNVSIEWKTIIPIFILLMLITIIVSCITDFIICNRNKKIYKLIDENNYDLVIKKANTLKKLMIFRSDLSNQILNLSVAVMCLQYKDIYNFEKYIDKINHKRLRAIRYYWKTIAYLVEENFKDAKKTYEMFKNSFKKLIKRSMPYEFFETILCGFISYYDGDEKTAKEKLTLVYDKLSSSITKQLCYEILMKS